MNSCNVGRLWEQRTWRMYNIAKEIRRRGFHSREIEYCDKILVNDYEYVTSMHSSLENFTKRTKDALFFRKTTDWKYEQEYRIIAIHEYKAIINIKIIKGNNLTCKKS